MWLPRLNYRRARVIGETNFPRNFSQSFCNLHNNNNNDDNNKTRGRASGKSEAGNSTRHAFYRGGGGGAFSILGWNLRERKVASLGRQEARPWRGLLVGNDGRRSFIGLSAPLEENFATPPPSPPPSVEFREKSIIDDDLLRPRDIFLEKGGGIPGYLDSYLQIEGRLREKFWRRFMHGSCTFLHRPPLLIQRPRRCAERAGSREENQAGANKSGEINKTFPEGCFLFILAASFRPPTNFSCSSHGLRVNIWPGRSSLKKDANLGESVEGNSTANFHDQIPRKMDTPE